MAIQLKPPPAATPAAGAAGPARGAAFLHDLRDRLNRIGTRRIGMRDRMMFTERLALLLETGVSLHEGLTAMREQSADPAVKAIVSAIAEDILDGRPLSVALARHPTMFPPTYVNLVAAAEDGGFLAQVLQQLIEMDEKSERMRNMLVSALSYPVFLVCFSGATVIFVLVGVFPKFSEMFARIRDDLPLSTRLLMALSDGLRLHWPWWIAGIGLLCAGLALWLRQPATRIALDDLKLRLPGARDLYAQVYLTQTLRVLGLSLSNGVPMVDALHACRELVRNATFRGFIDTLRVQVTEGRGIAYGFRQASFVPALVQQMIDTGEDTGSLAEGDDARRRLLRPRADQTHRHAVAPGRAGDAARDGQRRRPDRRLPDPADLQAEPRRALKHDRRRRRGIRTPRTHAALQPPRQPSIPQLPPSLSQPAV